MGSQGNKDAPVLVPPHVVIFPFMAQGHILPLLDFSKAISNRGIKVTIITTPSNASSIVSHVSKHTNISLKQIPFPSLEHLGLPEGCENTSQLPSFDLHFPFCMATKLLQQPFHDFLQEMLENRSLPTCVISDFFLGFTLETCRVFGVPRIVFHGMGVLAMAISKTIWTHGSRLIAESTESGSLQLPGLKLPFELTKGDIPDTLDVPNHDSPMAKYITEISDADENSWGVIVNSFGALERPHVAPFEAFYKNGAKAYCVGPLILYNEIKHDTEIAIDKHQKWLNDRAMSGSVLYVSFGTQATVSDAQLNEVAYGLETSGCSFLWAARSKTWTLPEDLERRVNDRGLITRDWVQQPQILSHRATGGFLSHCGWNSVLESLCAGVPILAWPMIAEQSFNAKLVVEGLRAGARVTTGSTLDPNVFIGREEICNSVRELMGGEKGRSAKERAHALEREARRAVQEGGSSHKSLAELIDKLCG
ncbi:hypothetical protein GIB67_006186 [Kingdonia uniflora]|uniref:Glycosyltransferase n=1 Tax=Kingdonia uniflora TaxID=39325 RepID=A0A7J7LQA8_9MAGN|nr:hypothetical protein GIB67_006186 [Kingdonia uniflora]